VLGGKLAGADLEAKVKHLVNWAKANNAPMNLAMVNSCLHWHLAHTPGPNERQMVLAVAQEFEAEVRRFSGQLWMTKETGIYGPLPFASTGAVVGLSESLWFERLFPEARIDWPQTFTHAQKYGQQVVDEAIRIINKAGLLPREITDPITAASYLSGSSRLQEMRSRASRPGLGEISFFYSLVGDEIVSKGIVFALFSLIRVPQYKDLIASNIVDEPGQGFNKLRQTLTVRNRVIVKGAKEGTLNLLGYPAEPGVGCFPVNSRGEESWIFRIPDGGMDTLLMLFVKNQWPIGYAFSLPGIKPEGPCVGFHIFREHRGTPSSDYSFSALLTAAARVQGAHKCFIQRRISESVDQLRAPESETVLTTFYEKHGFRWCSPDQAFMERGL